VPRTCSARGDRLLCLRSVCPSSVTRREILAVARSGDTACRPGIDAVFLPRPTIAAGGGAHVGRPGCPAREPSSFVTVAPKRRRLSMPGEQPGPPLRLVATLCGRVGFDQSDVFFPAVGGPTNWPMSPETWRTDLVSLRDYWRETAVSFLAEPHEPESPMKMRGWGSVFPLDKRERWQAWCWRTARPARKWKKLGHEQCLVPRGRRRGVIIRQLVCVCGVVSATDS